MGQMAQFRDRRVQSIQQLQQIAPSPAVFVAATLTAQAAPNLKTARNIEVRKGLRGRVDLIVVFRSRKASQFRHIVREPLGNAWQRHKAVFEPRCLGREPHDFAISLDKPDRRERTARDGVSSMSRLFSGGPSRSPVSRT